MTDLQQYRQEIDRIDNEIVRLFEERMEVCEKVAEYKIQTGKQVLDPEREKVKIDAVKAKAHTSFNAMGTGELFKLIMAISRKRQYQLLTQNGIGENSEFEKIRELPREGVTVVFQGVEGAYSYGAMRAYFKENINSYHVKTFKDAMEEVAAGRADYAVLPIENSTAGTVNEIYELLVEFEDYIVGEQIIKIEHCLLGVPGADISDIKSVYSHPQSLMQSSHFLSDRGWQQISMKNNAFAAKKVSEDADKSQAAIASEYAAKLYGLEVLKKGVNDNEDNSTRFIIVTNQKVFKEDAKKISICFELPHESGSLYHMLSHFIYNNLNLTKIESRPIRERAWEYRFFIDFEGNLSDESVKNALRGLREEALNMRILGNY